MLGFKCDINIVTKNICNASVACFHFITYKTGTIVSFTGFLLELSKYLGIKKIIKIKKEQILYLCSIWLLETANHQHVPHSTLLFIFNSCLQ